MLGFSFPSIASAETRRLAQPAGFRIDVQANFALGKRLGGPPALVVLGSEAVALTLVVHFPNVTASVPVLAEHLGRVASHPFRRSNRKHRRESQ